MKNLSDRDDSEQERVLALRNLRILDTEREAEFDQLVELASMIFEVPIVAISLVDENRQWFKGSCGLSVSQTPRDISFCTHAIQSDAPMIVEDATLDPRFAGNPLVVSSPSIRFYAGAILKSSDGHRIGTLCLIDTKPRKLKLNQIHAHRLLASQCETLILQRSKQIQLQKENRLLQLEIERRKTDFFQPGLVLNSLNSGVLFFNETGKIAYWNAWARLAFGIAETVEVEGLHLELTPFFLGVTPAETGKLEIAVRSYLEKKQTTTLATVECQNGKFIDIEFIPTFELSDFKGTVLKVRDVTERAFLKKQVDTQQIQIAESLRLKALGEMAGGLSHEINSPLAILRGRLFQIEEYAKSNDLVAEKVITTTQQCQNVIERITKIAKGLRAFASGAESEAPEKIELGLVVDDTLTFCQSRIKDLGIKLELDRNHSNASSFCRPIQISQILLNLLNNACDSLENHAGSKIIRVSFSEVDEHVLIHIEDTGPGVPESIVNSIFTPFFTTKPPNRGTGMGLSISRRIAMENDGDLELSSRLNPTRFSLRLKRI
ncbi:MAG: GHKL domain-containing protein [Bdellovibrionales bacterium]|nr:GHKL domain-containing protein [Bdellovibrionales bacterium]